MSGCSCIGSGRSHVQASAVRHFPAPRKVEGRHRQEAYPETKCHNSLTKTVSTPCYSRQIRFLKPHEKTFVGVLYKTSLL
eukprot:3192861-Amphidinium_carterae.1